MHLESNTAEETPRHLVDLDKAPLVAGRTVRALAYSSHMLIGAGSGWLVARGLRRKRQYVRCRHSAGCQEMTALEASIVVAWEAATTDLEIQFTSPFVVTTSDGRRQEFLGLVHSFGRRLGTIIVVLNEPFARSERRALDGYSCSELGPAYARYDRQLFMDTLNDWQFCGTEEECPAWYSGSAWS